LQYLGQVHIYHWVNRSVDPLAALPFGQLARLAASAIFRGAPLGVLPHRPHEILDRDFAGHRVVAVQKLFCQLSAHYGGHQ